MHYMNREEFFLPDFLLPLKKNKKKKTSKVIIVIKHPSCQAELTMQRLNKKKKIHRTDDEIYFL